MPNPTTTTHPKPPWLRVRLRDTPRVAETQARLRGHGLNTVCEAARCPNLAECWGAGHATFLILGDQCTRHCRFCNINASAPQPPDPGEPERVAAAVAEAGLCHAVVTSVTRDDLADGGATHWRTTLEALQKAAPETTVEALVPDFGGSAASLATVLEGRPAVLGHNLETVPRLYKAVRPGADYRRSLDVLSHAARNGFTAKTSLLLGLGEARGELLGVFRDAAAAGCRILYLGQYLAPTPAHFPVAEYVPPEQFDDLKKAAYDAGFEVVSAAPLVRSSYADKAQTLFLQQHGKRHAADHGGNQA